MSVATRNYIQKTIERLYGYIQGISIDCQINDKEIAALTNWVQSHDYMHDIYPFKELIPKIQEILDDGVIDADEREELSEWCANIINDRGFLNDFTQIIRCLHGIMVGVLCDKRVRVSELSGLRDWLEDYECLKDWWPFNELNIKIKKILLDGQVDEDEQKELLDFFKDFNEQVYAHPNIHDEEYVSDDHLRSPGTVIHSISSICEKNPVICFKGRKFCFTGPAASAKRKDLFAAVEELGGTAHNTAIVGLDYLVIGAQASPAWVYSTYGRKIETVMQRKNEKNNVCIVQEYDFISAARKVGGDTIIPNLNLPPF